MKARNAMMIVPLALFALLAAGCSVTDGSESNADTNAVESDGDRAPVAKSEPLVVPAGTVFDVMFEEAISSETSQVGDRFYVSVVNPIYAGSEVAIPAGSYLEGEVVEVQPAKRLGGQAKLAVDFRSLDVAGVGTVPVSVAFADAAKKHGKKDATTVGAATAGGAIVGRIVGHNNGEEADGTTIGALVGAAVGTAIAASNKGEEVTIPDGTIVQLEFAMTVGVDR